MESHAIWRLKKSAKAFIKQNYFNNTTMNNDLTQESDPNELIKELKAAYQQVYEENKRLREENDSLKKTIESWTESTQNRKK